MGRIGTPLKDWDIQINYGIKTGFNEAFIIDGTKRKELIEQDLKSDEIIRPILAGKDIKRYGYNFADRWLINTHNGIKEKGVKPININDYPAIKKHLDSHWTAIEKRADQGDTPYNLRNCAYMDDFSRPKIVWKRVGSILRFCFDDTGCFALDSTCIATGNYIKFLVCFLNSKMGNYLLQDSPKTGTGDLLVSIQAIEPLKVPLISNEQEHLFSNLFDKIQKEVSQSKLLIFEKQIDEIIFDLYGLSDDERNTIGLIETQ